MTEPDPPDAPDPPNPTDGRETASDDVQNVDLDDALIGRMEMQDIPEIETVLASLPPPAAAISSLSGAALACWPPPKRLSAMTLD